MGPVPAVVYAAMLGATTAGQLAGIGLDASIGSHEIWLPAICSVALEALVGARMGAARTGAPLSGSGSARVSIYYSTALVAVTVPLVVWFAAARGPRELPLDVRSPSVALAWLAVLVVGTGLRWVLMVAFRPRQS
ncbi:MAG TPA: hypothetical protein VKU41_29075 [Polyangiaceae bacterium]|nr:hypothetical protein [Polyangiaceae bacterium]